MSRSITPAVLTSMMARESSEGYVILLTIDHSDIVSPIRICSNATNFTSRSQTFLSCPFLVNLPQESEDAPAKVQLSVQNVDRQIVLAVRSVTPGTANPTVLMELVTLSNPNTLEAGPFHFTLKSAEWDREVVSSEISYEDIISEPYPVGSFTPGLFPGMFT